MCGIVGYVGNAQATNVLINGLKKLEYRGYDSAGVALMTEKNIDIVKTKGRLANLEEKIQTAELPVFNCGIGHTRWATHGEPSDVNSHPHLSNDGKFAVVHNGIIENYAKLKEKLTDKGYKFLSDTDTEVIVHLVEYYYKGDMLETIIKIMEKMKGSYALGILSTDEPDTIYAVRKDSPLIIGLGTGENFIASDIPAVLEYTKDYYLVEDGEIAVLTTNGVQVYNPDKELIDKSIFTVNWDVNAAEKGGYEHFMLKEMLEQPDAFRKTINPRIQNGLPYFENLGLDDEFIKNIAKIHIVACGSASHVGVVCKYLMEELTRIPTDIELASEFRYMNPILSENDLCIIISQSGETADSLAALREAKSKGVKVLSVVNVLGSTIARESDYVLYTWAGPEIAVATTKAYLTQLALITLLITHIAKTRGLLTAEETTALLDQMVTVPEHLEEILKTHDKYQYIASKFQNSKDLFFIGRGVDYALAMEGSLKLKEISYIHSEAYAAGELKHGTISLVEEGTPVFAIATQERLMEKMLSNIREVKARGATIISLTLDNESSADIENASDYIIKIPKIADQLLPLLGVVPLQLIAYYISALRGCDVDKPRNLAKSVTVE